MVGVPKSPQELFEVSTLYYLTYFPAYDKLWQYYFNSQNNLPTLALSLGVSSYPSLYEAITNLPDVDQDILPVLVRIGKDVFVHKLIVSENPDEVFKPETGLRKLPYLDVPSGSKMGSRLEGYMRCFVYQKPRGEISACLLRISDYEFIAREYFERDLGKEYRVRIAGNKLEVKET